MAGFVSSSIFSPSPSPSLSPPTVGPGPGAPAADAAGVSSVVVVVVASSPSFLASSLFSSFGGSTLGLGLVTIGLHAVSRF